MLSRQEFTKKIAKKIKVLRESKNMSQEELADRAKLYRTYIGHIENARYSPSAYVLYKIADALGISRFDLLSLE
jgi:transcriptional regulator with XRE-family HTH domain